MWTSDGRVGLERYVQVEVATGLIPGPPEEPPRRGSSRAPSAIETHPRVAGVRSSPPPAIFTANNGKGYRERTVYAMNGGRQAIDAWIALRGDAPGPLLAPVGQTGAIDVRPMTSQALMMRLRHRAKAANIGHCSLHDLHRSLVSTALESGADLAIAQGLAGHASPAATAPYDRRLEHAKAEAAKLVHVPFVAESGA